MIEAFVKKFGVLYATLVATVLTVMVSVCITATIMVSFHMPNLFGVIMIAVVCPLVIVPPLCRTLFGLYEKAERDRMQLEQLNGQLEATLKEVKELSGLLPICSSCKKIRDDKGYWNQLEDYFSNRSNVDFSHSICPECAKRLYPEYYEESDDAL